MEKEQHILLASRIKPDHAFYVQGDDRLYVACYSSVASLTVRFSGYFLSANGEVRQYAIDVAPTNDRLETSKLQTLGEGFLLSCMVHILGGNAKRGQCYVRARIQRGTAATIVPIARLVGGYVTDDYGPSWPWGKIEGPLEGPGYPRVVTGTNPAAGADIDEFVPTGARWRIIQVASFLVTDATVANRYAYMQFAHGAAYVAQASTPQAQAASLSRYYAFGPGIDYLYDPVYPLNLIPLPAITLLAGDEIFMSATNLVAGDNWDAPTLSVEEWIEA